MQSNTDLTPNRHEPQPKTTSTAAPTFDITSSAPVFKDWTEKNGLSFPQRLKMLEELDSLCEKCLDSSEMLCSGVRPTFIPEDLDVQEELRPHYVPFMINGMCAKGQEKYLWEQMEEDAIQAGFGQMVVQDFVAKRITPRVLYDRESRSFVGTTGKPRPDIFKYDASDRILIHRIAMWALREITVWHIHVSTVVEAMKTKPWILDERGSADLVVVTGIEDLKPWGAGADLGTYLHDRVQLNRMTWLQKPQGTIQVDQFVKQWFDEVPNQ